jgi:uncharacterized repeat protein (TIGR03803 family)
MELTGTTLRPLCKVQTAISMGLPRQAGPKCADGSFALGALVQGTNGRFYGAASFGGISPYCQQVVGGGDYGCGTIFEITPTGELRTLYNFCALKKCADGVSPRFSRVLTL